MADDNVDQSTEHPIARSLEVSEDNYAGVPEKHDSGDSYPKASYEDDQDRYDDGGQSDQTYDERRTDEDRQEGDSEPSREFADDLEGQGRYYTDQLSGTMEDAGEQVAAQSEEGVSNVLEAGGSYVEEGAGLVDDADEMTGQARDQAEEGVGDVLDAAGDIGDIY